MRDLAEAGRSVIDSPPAPPTPIDQIEARAHGRRRRGRVRAATALVTAVALIGGALAIAADRHSTPSPIATKHPTKTTVTPPTSTKPPNDPKLRAHLGFDAPKGWKPADYGDARLWVPPRWYQFTANPCAQPSGHWILYSLGAGSQVLCGPVGPTGPGGRPTPTTAPPAPTPPSITITKLSASATDGARRRVVNSYSVFIERGPGSTLTWSVPALDVTITTTTAFERELETIGPSARIIALDSAPQPVPSDWRRVTDKGISIAVPGTWPTRLVTDPYCVHFDPGTAWAGAVHQTEQHCSGPDDLRSRPEPEDGAWLASGVPLEPFARPVTGNWERGLHVSVESGGDAVLLVWANIGKDFRSVQIGLGPDGRVANAILHSIEIAPTTSFSVDGCTTDLGPLSGHVSNSEREVVPGHPARALLCVHSSIVHSAGSLVGAENLDVTRIASLLDSAGAVGSCLGSSLVTASLRFEYTNGAPPLVAEVGDCGTMIGTRFVGTPLELWNAVREVATG